MANKKYKLTDGNMWATDGIHDFGQNKTQRTINSEVNSALGGKAPTNHASTATTYGAASTSNYGHVKLSNTTPSMDGTAAVGDSTDVARANHVHPSDTSRVPTTRKINGMDLSQDRTLTSENIGYNSSTTYSSGTVGKAVSDLNGAINDITPLTTTPTSGSAKGITSGAVYTALNSFETIPITLNQNAITRGYITCWKFGKIVIIDANIINDSANIPVNTQLATGFPIPLANMYTYVTAYNKVQNVLLHDSGALYVVDADLTSATWWKTNTVYICQ